MNGGSCQSSSKKPRRKKTPDRPNQEKKDKRAWGYFLRGIGRGLPKRCQSWKGSLLCEKTSHARKRGKLFISAGKRSDFPADRQLRQIERTRGIERGRLGGPISDRSGREGNIGKTTKSGKPMVDERGPAGDATSNKREDQRGNFYTSTRKGWEREKGKGCAQR